MNNQVQSGPVVKKAYQPMVNLLSAHVDKTVGEVIDDIITMCSAKSGTRMGITFLKDANGLVLAVFCWYHKLWEIVVDENAVEYSPKPNTATKLNSMCKIGNNLWSKENNERKRKEKVNYDAFVAGTLTQEEAKAQRDAEAAEPKGPNMEGAPVGYATKEEVIEVLAQMGYTAITS